MLLEMGDWNAKVGARQEGDSGIVGQHGLNYERNDNDDRFVTFCAFNNLAITSTMFPHKDVHTAGNQIDHLAVRSQFKKSVQDTRVHRGADVGSDHNFVKLRLKSTGKKKGGDQQVRGEQRRQFQLELRNRFSFLQTSEQTRTDGVQSAVCKWQKPYLVYL